MRRAVTMEMVLVAFGWVALFTRVVGWNKQIAQVRKHRVRG